MQYDFLWKEDKQQAYETLMRTNPDLDSFDQELQKYADIEKKINEIPPVSACELAVADRCVCQGVDSFNGDTFLDVFVRRTELVRLIPHTAASFLAPRSNLAAEFEGVRQAGLELRMQSHKEIERDRMTYEDIERDRMTYEDIESHVARILP